MDAEYVPDLVKRAFGAVTMRRMLAGLVPCLWCDVGLVCGERRETWDSIENDLPMFAQLPMHGRRSYRGGLISYQLTHMRPGAVKLRCLRIDQDHCGFITVERVSAASENG